jgi:hypothetical protein
MPPRWNENRLTAKLGIDYTIIQGPLGGLSSQPLTAAVSNFGELGSFGAHGLSPGAIKDVIAEIRSLTSKPFAMNLWVSMEDEDARTSDENVFNRSLGPLAVHMAALGAPRPEYKPYPWIRFEDQARVLLDEKVPVFSFIYGIPPQEILEECRAKHILTIGTPTTPEEGAALQEAGVDAVVASGFESGGHRGSFLRSAEESLTSTFSLVPQIADMVNVPVIAAGGIADARRNRRSGSWRGGRANGNGISGVRRVRRQPPSSPSFMGEERRAHRADKGLHRQTRAGNPQPLAGGVEPGGNGDSTLSVAAKPPQKPRDPGRGGGPIGSPAPMDWAKCQSFYLHQRIGFLDLTGREGL